MQSDQKQDEVMKQVPPIVNETVPINSELNAKTTVSSCFEQLHSVDPRGSTKVKFKRLDHLAILPFRFKDGCAGFDLHSVQDVLVKESSTRFIRTGWQVEDIPAGYFLRIEDRSGVKPRHLRVLPRIIDGSTIDRELIVTVTNPFTEYGSGIDIKVGHLIGQLVIEKICNEVEVVEAA